MALIDFANIRPAPFARMIGGARKWLADKSHDALAQRIAGSAFLIRVASAGLIFIVQIFLARWMGRFEFGIYIYVWTWVLLIGALAPLGLGYLAQRFIPEYSAKRDLKRLRGFLFASRWICFGLGALAAIVGTLVILGLGERIAAYYTLPFLIGLVCLPIFAVSSVQDSIARSYNWIDLALVPDYIAQPLLILAFIASMHFAGMPVNAVAVLFAAVLAYWAMTLMQTGLLGRRLGTVVKPGPRRYDVAHWMQTALPVFLVDGCFFLLTYIDILLLELFVSPEEIAVYYAAVKTLALVAFIYFAVSAACAHRFAEYHASKNKKKLAAFVHQATRMMFWPSLAMAAALVVFGKWILMLFGPGFEEGYPLILVLAIGLIARASVGPAERLLSMVGEQKICALVYAAAVLANIALCFILVPRLGLIGAAASTASALVLESILLFFAVKKRLGLHVFIWR